MMIYELKT